VAWDVADIRESRPTRLIAGSAQRRPGHAWRAYPLENATLRTIGSFVAENALAVPLVAANGAIAITWTGAVDNTARVGVKAARLTSGGPPNSSRRRGQRNGRRRGGGTERPGGDRVVAVRHPEPHLHPRSAVASAGRPVRPADLLTPPETIGISGPAVAFQTVTGRAVAIVPITQANSGGFVSAIQAP
jgi:hypothetical protein